MKRIISAILVNDICKTVGLDPSENYTAIRQKLDE